MRAANRQALKTDPEKMTKFPRTSRREERIQSVLTRRQPNLTVVLENVHDPHNVGAVLRSCDAVGILRVHTIYSVEELPERAYARRTSGSASKWIEVNHHRSVEDCYAALRAEGFTILVTALTETGIDLYRADFSQPVALVFGNEQRGASDAAVERADRAIEIPMMGMVESLNISVACAVSLFEAMRQRREAGLYEAPQLDDAMITSLTADWLER